MKYLVFSVSFFVFLNLQAGINYYGYDHTEAQLQFTAYIEFSNYQRKPSEAQVRKGIDAQLSHMYGTMENSWYKGVPNEDYAISDIQFQSNENGIYRFTYNYKGIVVIQNNENQQYPIILPVNPMQVYNESLKSMRRGTNPCTDSHYQEEGDFWYFWSPYRSGCKLIEGKDFFVVSAEVLRQSNTSTTYPEYQRLIKNNEIKISIIFGLYDSENSIDPNKSNDENIDTFHYVKQSLIEAGYQSAVYTDIEKQKLFKAKANSFYLEDLTKTVNIQGRDLKLTVQISIVDSELSFSSKAFHHVYKDALENSSVIIYDGHSGLGGNLNVSYIESYREFKIKLDKNQYQILFFNSCSSYPYYNNDYFYMKSNSINKKGTKNLDIITAGLSTSVSGSEDANLALIMAIDNWAQGVKSTSYQELINKMDTGNMLGVNGDEDNPTAP